MTDKELSRGKEIRGKIICLEQLIKMIGDYSGGVVGVTINHGDNLMIIRIPSTMLPGIKTLAEIEKSYLEAEFKKL